MSGLCTSVAAAGEDDAAPPYMLMEAPPLAVFTNGVLAALNELRHCAPLALRDLFTSRLQVPILSSTSFGWVGSLRAVARVATITVQRLCIKHCSILMCCDPSMLGQSMACVSRCWLAA